MEEARLADVRAGNETESRQAGSGYLVAPQLVLTARHVVHGKDGMPLPRIDVRVGHPRDGAVARRRAQVCWPDPRPRARENTGAKTGADPGDAALLWLDAPVDTASASGVRWGRPVGGQAVPYLGVGFPALAAYEEDGGARGVETVRGMLAPLSTGPGGTFVLDQDAAPASRHRGTRPWQGVSGAAVFCHGTLVGIVVKDDAGFAYSRLHALPAHTLFAHPGFTELLRNHAVGMPDVEDIDALRTPGGIPAPTAVPVSQWDPLELEIHAALSPEGTAGDPLTPYLMRRHDNELRELLRPALAGGPSVLAVVTGGSSTGKTRALYEALLALAPDRPLLRAADAADLTHLLEAGGPPADAVLWLDEAQRYLYGDAGEKAAAALRTVWERRPGLVAVATLWTRPYWEELAARGVTGGAHVQASALLLAPRTRRIRVPDVLEPADLVKWEKFSSQDSRLGRALSAGRSDGWVVQHLSGGPDLVTAYLAGPGGPFDHGEHALLTAALDARRLGHRGPLDERLLADAAEGCLAPRHRGTGADWARQALAAVSTVSPSDTSRALPALIPVYTRPGGPARYEPADYLFQHARQSRFLQLGSPALWEALITHTTDAEDLVALAENARMRNFDKIAVRLLRRAVDAGHPSAASSLAMRLNRHTDPNGRGRVWLANHAVLDGGDYFDMLLDALADSGAVEAVRTIAARADLTDQETAAQVANAIVRVAATSADPTGEPEEVDVPLAVGFLQTEGAHPDPALAIAVRSGDEALARTATDAQLADPHTAARLVRALADAGEPAAAQSLGIRAAQVADLQVVTDRIGVARLLSALHQVGGLELARQAAVRAELSDMFRFGYLMTALGKVGDLELALTLAEWISTVYPLFRDPPTPWGRRPDGEPEQPWSWDNLDNTPT